MIDALDIAHAEDMRHERTENSLLLEWLHIEHKCYGDFSLVVKTDELQETVLACGECHEAWRRLYSAKSSYSIAA